ncbi:MAG: hypothetical protein Q7T96_02100 [Methylobacter sp.]|nr:hypothetical protein [Methylobacter sp.]
MKILLTGLLVAMTSFSSFAADDTSVVDLSNNKSSPAPAENQNTSTVDLSDKKSDTVYSPSLENTTPAGQAPGGPIESK